MASRVRERNCFQGIVCSDPVSGGLGKAIEGAACPGTL